tara:strand:+ start:355 stop:735 length:381 start_codon:yes stop_codon:yes gene_type:complete
MKTTTLKITAFLFSLIIIATTFSSCTKDSDTIGIIKVVNSSGQAMSGVTVVLNQQNSIPGTDPIENLKQTKTTDANGKASFTYRYESILDVNVSYTNISGDTYSGSGVIRLLRGKTEQITVEAIKQ